VLTIGQLAKATGVPTSTIRFWERRGLLAPQARLAGQRRYSEDAAHQVGLLLLCQDAGFTLAEIQRMIAQRATDPTTWRRLVEDKMVDVESSLAKLHKAYELLSHALDCHHDDILSCPDFQEAVRHRVAGAATATDLPAPVG
jgi:MerR family redox-sensitive transcriptional activator SoxR